MASSSPHKQRQLHLPNIYVGANSAPPPTPSNHRSSTSASAVADALSQLLHRLPSPTLSLPSARTGGSPSATRPPLFSLSNPDPDDQFLPSASRLGFFQLTNHNISPQLAHSAESEALSLFELERDKKEIYFPRNWPLGYEANEDEVEVEGGGNGESFCLDSTCSSESTELNLTSLREFTGAMEKVGLKVIEIMASAVGFENPLGDDPTRFCSLMWMSKNMHGDNPVLSGGYYPYIVGLKYQIRPWNHTLVTNSGSVPVSTQVDSILVTLGDIAQVWSNGKTKKVRSGRPMAGLRDEKNKSADEERISMIMLVTLPIDSIVSPLIPKLDVDDNNNGDENIKEGQSECQDDDDEDEDEDEERKLFESFPLEDYAWRVYHERLLFNDDPLDRYRI